MIHAEAQIVQLEVTSIDNNTLKGVRHGEICKAINNVGIKVSPLVVMEGMMKLNDSSQSCEVLQRLPQVQVRNKTKSSKRMARIKMAVDSIDEKQWMETLLDYVTERQKTNKI